MKENGDTEKKFTIKATKLIHAHENKTRTQSHTLAHTHARLHARMHTQRKKYIKHTLNKVVSQVQGFHGKPEN